MLNPYLKKKKIPNNIGINITQGKEISLAKKGRPPLRIITYEDKTPEPADKEELSILRNTAKAHLIVAALDHYNCDLCSMYSSAWGIRGK
jgi:hypothetical protein